MATKNEQIVNWFLRVLGGEDYKKLASNFNLHTSEIKENIKELAILISGEIQGDFTIEGFRTKRSFWLNALSNFCECLEKNTWKSKSVAEIYGGAIWSKHYLIKDLEKIKKDYAFKEINNKNLNIFKKVVQGITYVKLSEEQKISPAKLAQIVEEMVKAIQWFIKCAPELDKDFSKKLKVSHKKDFKTNRETWLKVINLFEIFHGFLNPDQLI